MSGGRKVLAGLFWGQVGMSLRSVFCFAISITIARSLGADDFGIYSALVSVVAVLLLCSNLGIYSVFSNYLPRFAEEGSPGAASYLVRRAVLLRTALMIVLGGLLYLLRAPLTELTGIAVLSEFALLLIVWLLMRGLADVFVFVVMSRLEMQYFAMVETIVSGIQLAAVLYLAQTGMQLRSLVIVMVMVYTLQAVLYAVGTRAIYGPRPQPIDVAPILRYGLVLWLCTIIQRFLNNDLDVLMILHFLRDEALAGYYNIAYMLTTTGGYILLGSLNSLTLPILSKAYARGGLPEMAQAWEFLYKLSVILSAPVFAYVAVHAESIVVALYADEYLAAAPLLGTFAMFYGLTAFLGMGPAVSVMLPLGKEKWVLYLRGGGGVLNLALNLICIPLLGIRGAVLATGASVVTVALAELVGMHLVTGFRLHSGYALRVLPIIVLPALGTRVLGPLGLTGLTFVALAYGLLVVRLVLWVCPLSERELAMADDSVPKLTALLRFLRLLPVAVPVTKDDNAAL